ncbi:hypothetical protein EYF80_020708 [Liparis tanakae]|uniref:Uncharacterized protein n=1 Tax=Liparis tanakae TaxID=230148 RepID=A0A4Z2HUL6_9TELE|nr:hypothetical protein EYF80_020708 [Liparis tanakae]
MRNLTAAHGNAARLVTPEPESCRSEQRAAPLLLVFRFSPRRPAGPPGPRASPRHAIPSPRAPDRRPGPDGGAAAAAPAKVRVGEQRVLAPLGHVAVVIAVVVHGLRGVVGGQVMRRRVLRRAGAAPLGEGLLGAVRAVDVVADHARLAGLGRAHVEGPAVVLGPGEGLGAARRRAARRGAARRRARLVGAGLRRVVVGDGGDVGDAGLEAAASRAAELAAGTSCSALYTSLGSAAAAGDPVLPPGSLSAAHGEYRSSLTPSASFLLGGSPPSAS